LSPAKGSFVARLWTRLGVRTFSVGLLVLGLVGGLALGVNRQTQSASDRTHQSAMSERDELHQLLADRNAFHKATAGQRDAQADAQAAGAVPGFGKREIGSPKVKEVLRSALGES